MTDFLEEKRKEISKRLTELRPLVDEFHRLEEAEQALSGVGGSTTKASSSSSNSTSTSSTRSQSKRRRGRPAGRKRTASAKTRTANNSSGKRGRPRGSGTRAAEALDLVRSRPGITIPELADAMGIKQNYLYRVMPTLAEQRLVTKSGRGWHARESS